MEASPVIRSECARRPGCRAAPWCHRDHVAFECAENPTLSARVYGGFHHCGPRRLRLPAFRGVDGAIPCCPRHPFQRLRGDVLQPRATLFVCRG